MHPPFKVLDPGKSQIKTKLLLELRKILLIQAKVMYLSYKYLIISPAPLQPPLPPPSLCICHWNYASIMFHKQLRMAQI